MNLVNAILMGLHEKIPMYGTFNAPVTFVIGFINPDIENVDDIANDETEFTAESISELQMLYDDFCAENGIPNDTVRYVEM